MTDRRSPQEAATGIQLHVEGTGKGGRIREGGGQAAAANPVLELRKQCRRLSLELKKLGILVTMQYIESRVQKKPALSPFISELYSEKSSPLILSKSIETNHSNASLTYVNMLT